MITIEDLITEPMKFEMVHESTDCPIAEIHYQIPNNDISGALMLTKSQALTLLANTSILRDIALDACKALTE